LPIRGFDKNFFFAFGGLLALFALAWLLSRALHVSYLLVLVVIGALAWIVLEYFERRIKRQHAEDDAQSRVREVDGPTGRTLVWPPLPDGELVRGRAAVAADVEAAHAVFVMSELTRRQGRPVDIALPQYGWLRESADTEPVPIAVIQAETDGEDTYYGFFTLDDLQLDFAPAGDVQLLGIQPPQQGT